MLGGACEILDHTCQPLISFHVGWYKAHNVLLFHESIKMPHLTLRQPSKNKALKGIKTTSIIPPQIRP